MEELVKAILGLKISTEMKIELLAMLRDGLAGLGKLASEAVDAVVVGQRMKVIDQGVRILTEGLPAEQAAQAVLGIVKGAEQEPEGASTGTRIAIRCRQCTEVVRPGENFSFSVAAESNIGRLTVAISNWGPCLPLLYEASLSGGIYEKICQVPIPRGVGGENLSIRVECMNGAELTKEIPIREP